MLLGRYRIYGLLGRGGMGEVYRADDVKLGQTVALKFLPREVERDEDRRARLLDEVRIARQISHSSVCRVYDVGEVDGRPFISMEFVDGEDLAALLRRIGRLPKDKAVQIARQLCAGLAAAHEQGILHRDLKPANVMIDGRGRARITDFGLAELAGAGSGARGAGTPAYMAPEQLAGEPASIASDVYALGLVLYELFTGHRPFAANDAAELARLHRDSEPTTPSVHVEGFDPAVERVILRCLRRDPRERPGTAISVAAALPGGDPLAAALAAGETPSPQLVAEAGDVGGMTAAAAWIYGGALAVSVLLVVLLSPATQLLRMVPLPKSPEILAERARTLAETLGGTGAPLDTAYSFSADEDYLVYLARHDPSPDRWSKLATGRASAVMFWLRQSPAYLLPGDRYWLDVSFDDPPPIVPGMLRVMVDPRGRLHRFERIPAESDDVPASSADLDWSPFLREASLDASTLHAAEPRTLPPAFADRRVAWEGADSSEPGGTIRVEAASFRGRPVSFAIVHPWTRAGSGDPTPSTFFETASAVSVSVLLVSVLLGSAWLARRNVLQGRGDRKGTFRLAAFVFVTTATCVFLVGHFVPSIDETWRVFAAFGFPIIVSGIVGMLYLALEPYVRRFWPRMLVSWVRLLDGRIRDPLVGRDAVIGLLFGAALRAGEQLLQLADARLGTGTLMIDRISGPPLGVQVAALRGLRESVGGFGGYVVVPLLSIVGILALLLLCRVVFRRPWLAIAVFSVVFTLGGDRPGIGAMPFLIWSGLSTLVVLVLLFRVGLLALVVGYIFHTVLMSIPMTLDFSAWYAGRSLAVIAVGAAIAAYGIRNALPRGATSPARTGTGPST